ncbi:LON peptidase substrate-binding domain-containing protein [Geofilum rubicundum]|uniref:ATP-dependent protease n=1 Tax=Geofilum rubicundum JCM 15548 TaxID=1236989 RepID=A0A0E9LWK0_9BACT|nr:LON peptidase substrate-binding domain-containing protein [Geofilum rubicundum]GAO29255.1 ATP-dependent protease [Geofilum rubicundum JCM 15548]
MDNFKVSIGFSEMMDSDSEFIPIVEDEDYQMNKDDERMPEDLPLLPLRNTVLFPGVIVPISVGRERSLKLVKDVQRNKGFLGAVAQIDAAMEEPGTKDLYKVGTIARVLKILEMPDGSTSVIIQGRIRFKWKTVVSDDPYFKVSYKVLEDVVPEGDAKREFEAVIGSLKDLSLRIIKGSSNIPQELPLPLKISIVPLF